MVQGVRTGSRRKDACRGHSNRGIGRRRGRGDLTRGLRWAELLGPAGIGDELLAAPVCIRALAITDER